MRPVTKGLLRFIELHLYYVSVVVLTPPLKDAQQAAVLPEASEIYLLAQFALTQLDTVSASSEATEALELAEQREQDAAELTAAGAAVIDKAELRDQAVAALTVTAIQLERWCVFFAAFKGFELQAVSERALLKSLLELLKALEALPPRAQVKKRSECDARARKLGHSDLLFCRRWTSQEGESVLWMEWTEAGLHRGQDHANKDTRDKQHQVLHGPLAVDYYGQSAASSSKNNKQALPSQQRPSQLRVRTAREGAGVRTWKTLPGEPGRSSEAESEPWLKPVMMSGGGLGLRNGSSDDYSDPRLDKSSARSEWFWWGGVLGYVCGSSGQGTIGPAISLPLARACVPRRRLPCIRPDRAMGLWPAGLMAGPLELAATVAVVAAEAVFNFRFRLGC
eukprot:g40561.t1